MLKRYLELHKIRNCLSLQVEPTYSYPLSALLYIIQIISLTSNLLGCRMLPTVTTPTNIDIHWKLQGSRFSADSFHPVMSSDQGHFWWEYPSTFSYFSGSSHFLSRLLKHVAFQPAKSTDLFFKSQWRGTSQIHSIKCLMLPIISQINKGEHTRC